MAKPRKTTFLSFKIDGYTGGTITVPNIPSNTDVVEVFITEPASVQRTGIEVVEWTLVQGILPSTTTAGINTNGTGGTALPVGNGGKISIGGNAAAVYASGVNVRVQVTLAKTDDDDDDDD